MTGGESFTTIVIVAVPVPPYWSPKSYKKQKR